jgi:hypothetical protein
VHSLGDNQLEGFEVVIQETKIIAVGNCLLVPAGEKGLMLLLDVLVICCWSVSK